MRWYIHFWNKKIPCKIVQKRKVVTTSYESESEDAKSETESEEDEKIASAQKRQKIGPEPMRSKCIALFQRKGFEST